MSTSRNIWEISTGKNLPGRRNSTAINLQHPPLPALHAFTRLEWSWSGKVCGAVAAPHLPVPEGSVVVGKYSPCLPWTSPGGGDPQGKAPAYSSEQRPLPGEWIGGFARLPKDWSKRGQEEQGNALHSFLHLGSASLSPWASMGGECTTVHSCKSVSLIRELFQINTWNILLPKGACFPWEKLSEYLYIHLYWESSNSGRNIMNVHWKL